VILGRYIVREIAKPLVAVCAILLVIFISYTSARYLADAVDGVLPAQTIVSLVLLRTAIAVEVLLPITLFLSVVMAVGRLHADSEMVALAALGVNPARVARAVGGLGLGLAALVLALSVLVRPWAYDKSYRLRAEASAELDLGRLEAGRFYEQHGEHVIFAERYDRAQARMENVFLQSEEPGTVEVVYAKQAYQRVDPATGQRTLVALNGRHYTIALGEGSDRIVTFERSEMLLRDKEVTPEYRRKAAPTPALARSADPRDVAELQWRLTTPLSTVLLALLGVPLSRAVPRQGRHARFGAAVLVYAAYYNVKAMAKTWLELGAVGAFPGLWWVDALLAALVAVMLWQPWPRLRWRG
jgi:lipopolysaccharide export system permease protein